MQKGLVYDTTLGDIADAIRSKNGSDTVYKPSEMAAAINNLGGLAFYANASGNASFLYRQVSVNFSPVVTFETSAKKS